MRMMEIKVHDPVNLGNPVEITIKELAEIVIHLSGSKAGIEYLADRRDEHDPQQRRPDISRAKEVLGWEPSIPLEEGLKKSLDDFRRRL